MSRDATTPQAEVRVVPVEPTPEMLNAAIDVDAFKLGDIGPLGFRCSPQQLFSRIWSTMLAAAPVAPAGSDGEVWIVSASSGEWSDRREWNVSAHWCEQEAKDEVARLTVLARELAAEEPSTDNSTWEYDCPIYAAYQAWSAKVGDAIGGSDPEDTRFAAGPVPLASRAQPPAGEAVACSVCNGDGPTDGGICGGCGTSYAHPAEPAS